MRSVDPPSLDLQALRASLGDTLEARFELRNRVTEAPDSEVFAAHDRELGRDVNVKRVRAGAPDAEVRRLLVEAQVAAQLSHPNVIPLYSLEITHEGQPCFTTQQIRGESLATYIGRAPQMGDGRSGAYALRRRLEIFLAVCDAIAFAHASGVHHRNLSAATVTLGPFAEVYVTDWGFAMLGETPSGAAIELSVAPPSPAHGTPSFDANPHAASAAEDRTALARLLVQLVRLPQRGSAWPRPRRVARDLRVIIAGAESGRVYIDIRELAEDIRRFLRGESPAAHPDAPPRRLLRRVRRHPVDLLVALLAVSTLCGAFAVVRTFDRVGREHELAARTTALARISAAVTARADQLGGVAVEVETELYAARAALSVAATSTAVEASLRETVLRTSAIRAYAVLDGTSYSVGAPTPEPVALQPHGRADAHWEPPRRRVAHEPWVVPLIAEVIRADGATAGGVGLDLPLASFTVLTTRAPVRGLDALRLVDARGRHLDAQGMVPSSADVDVEHLLARGLESGITPTGVGATVIVRVHALGWYLVGDAESIP